MRRAMPWMVALALAAPVAQAQMPVGENLRAADDDTASTYEGRRVDQLEDLVLVHDGRKVGEVEEVLADMDGELVAVAVEVDKGFLDLGDREVIVPLALIQIGPEGDQGTVTLGEEEIRALPTWDE